MQGPSQAWHSVLLSWCRLFQLDYGAGHGLFNLALLGHRLRIPFGLDILRQKLVLSGETFLRTSLGGHRRLIFFSGLVALIVQHPIKLPKVDIKITPCPFSTSLPDGFLWCLRALLVSCGRRLLGKIWTKNGKHKQVTSQNDLAKSIVEDDLGLLGAVGLFISIRFL